MLQNLDDLRFRPADREGRAAITERVAELLDAAQHFVQQTTPAGPAS